MVSIKISDGDSCPKNPRDNNCQGSNNQPNGQPNNQQGSRLNNQQNITTTQQNTTISTQQNTTTSTQPSQEQTPQSSPSPLNSRSPNAYFVSQAILSLSPSPSNSQSLSYSATPSSGPIPSNIPYTGNANGTIKPTASTNNNTINTINTNNHNNNTLYDDGSNAPTAKFIPVIAVLFCVAIAGFLLLLFRKRLFKTRAFSQRSIFLIKHFTKFSKDRGLTDPHRLHDLDDWSVGSYDKDAQKVTIPPVARMSQVSYKRASSKEDSTIDLVSPTYGDESSSGINGNGKTVQCLDSTGFLRKSLSRLNSCSNWSGRNVEHSPEMAYLGNSQQQSLNQNPFEEFDVLVMPSTSERKVNWEDCMR